MANQIVHFQFHFATILSPWIRRALIAGGFGTGVPSAQLPLEIAPIVPFRYQEQSREQSDHKTGDIESSLKRRSDKSSPTSSVVHASDEAEVNEWAAFMYVRTPFFHFDLPSAVKAAEQSNSIAASIAPVNEEDLSGDSKFV